MAFRLDVREAVLRETPVSLYAGTAMVSLSVHVEERHWVPAFAGTAMISLSVKSSWLAGHHLKDAVIQPIRHGTQNARRDAHRPGNDGE